MTMRLPRPRSTFLEANLAQHNGQTTDNGRGRAVKIPRGFRMPTQGCPGFAGRPWGQGPHPGILKGCRTGSGCGVGGATPLGLVGGVGITQGSLPPPSLRRATLGFDVKSRWDFLKFGHLESP
jgi:hypothetical protein